MRGAIILWLALITVGCSEPPPSTDLVFVSDEAANVVHIVDGATGRIEGSLATGRRPRGMALSPDRRILYVAASDDNRIEAWDVASRRRVRLLDSGRDPERFVVSPDGRRLYIANEDNSAVSILDLASGRIEREVRVGPEPEGMGVSPDGRLVVATAEASSTVHFIDAATGDTRATAIVGTRPRDVLFLGGQIWISSEQRGTVSLFDARTLRLVRTIDLVPAFPDVTQVQSVEMDSTRDGHRVFVAMGRSDRVAEIDPATLQVVRSFPTGQRTWGIGLSPDDRRLYAASGLSGSLTIVDLTQNRVLRTVQLGGKPWTALAVAR